MSIYDFNVKDINENEVSMSKYKNKVLLIVNVASKCGFTGQYEGLEKLYQTYKNEDFMILGFPSNQFSNQEPGTNKEIQEFCTLTYGVDFDMFAKVDVNGENEIPLYTYLKKEASGILGTESIKWNFTKFLVNKEGKVVDRFGSTTKPKDIEDDIKKLLNK
ncbi:MAG: glutathione peroxidase [Arcobacter sp.]|uniref:glutathione peroxidase n=1 Tax=Poseidonibacter ostreae TaxID=2654171 RepID=UPI000C917318|nr:glutathione peroxidase [Poseidonibacter ostreae]KAB7884432.1 redoxin domain-containing protein [Poseidonibacter ostreae]MAC84852.1 glutathione peroxidase [Arcobacter sp.]